MKILLLGKNGQVGWELQRTLTTLGNVVSFGRNELDLANFDALRKAVHTVQPQLIVNAAAYTSVDKAESEPELAMAVNGIAPGILAKEAKHCNAVLIHYSTDYVYDGCKEAPYVEDDEPNPISVYGQSKLAGEIAIQETGLPYLIFRTSWVYGTRGNNFLMTILRLAKEKEELKVVNDQIGAPIWSRVIAEITAQIIAQCYSPITYYSSDVTKVSGLYHLTAAGQTSWHDFAKAILNLSIQFSASDAAFTLCPSRVLSILTREYSTPAQRPTYSVLSNEKLKKVFNLQVPDWRTQLEMVLQV